MKRNKLRYWRRRLQFRQEELAKAAGSSRAMIVLIERHDYLPTAPVRSRLAGALCVQESSIWPGLAELEAAAAGGGEGGRA